MAATILTIRSDCLTLPQNPIFVQKLERSPSPVYGSGLLNRQRIVKSSREFKSPPLRQKFLTCSGCTERQKEKLDVIFSFRTQVAAANI